MQGVFLQSRTLDQIMMLKTMWSQTLDNYTISCQINVSDAGLRPKRFGGKQTH